MAQAHLHSSPQLDWHRRLSGVCCYSARYWSASCIMSENWVCAPWKLADCLSVGNCPALQRRDGRQRPWMLQERAMALPSIFAQLVHQHAT
jgi:hypothetical protein